MRAAAFAASASSGIRAAAALRRGGGNGGWRCARRSLVFASAASPASHMSGGAPGDASAAGTAAMPSVKKHFAAKRFTEGAGFSVRRPIGGPQLTDEEADPFLLLDELGPVSYAKGEFPGAPWHPHRGFDTVMYLKAGEGQHRDSMGNSGTLRAGDCQWMTAASGIVHDEGRNHPGGLLHGFQMWVNLPAAHKMDPPAYQDVPSASIPVVEAAPGVTAKIIAGECAGKKAVVQTLIPIQYIDFVVQPGASFTHNVAAEMETVMAYVYSGSGKFTAAGVSAKEGDMLIFTGPGPLSFQGAGSAPMSFLLIAGKPIREPIARHGPFVMNTRAEIMTAFQEYQNDTFIKHKGTIKREF